MNITKSHLAGDVDIEFRLDVPAQGRGIGPQRGVVNRVRVSMPPQVCIALSHALLVAAADVTKGKVSLRVDEECQSVASIA